MYLPYAPEHEDNGQDNKGLLFLEMQSDRQKLLFFLFLMLLKRLFFALSSGQLSGSFSQIAIDELLPAIIKP